MSSRNVSTMAAAARIRRQPGRYVDLARRGCRVCGWSISNEDDPDDSLWLNHEHDPIHDIIDRVMSGVTLVPGEDVIYLLELIDAMKGGSK